MTRILITCKYGFEKCIIFTNPKADANIFKLYDSGKSQEGWEKILGGTVT